jgi:hypothetical protein
MRFFVKTEKSQSYQGIPVPVLADDLKNYALKTRQQTRQTNNRIENEWGGGGETKSKCLGGFLKLYLCLWY